MALLECFDNPCPGRHYVIEHTAEEFTSLCPKTGHPDFATVNIRYIPAERCIELKSLKLYLQAYRNEGIFYEAVTNKIADDLAEAMEPQWMVVQTDWSGRGGIRSSIRVEIGTPPANAPGSPLDDDDDGDDDDDYDDDLPAERPSDEDRVPPGF